MSLLLAQGALKWTQAYIGIPFRDRGRGPDGCDCWGLVRLVYREELAIALPSYDEHYVSATEREEIAAVVAGEAASPRWASVAPPAAFDVLFFRRGRLDAHAGLHLAPGLMLHMAEGDCAKIERYDGPRWRSRLTGAYRWREAT